MCLIIGNMVPISLVIFIKFIEITDLILQSAFGDENNIIKLEKCIALITV
jgi:hypothetical protein